MTFNLNRQIGNGKNGKVILVKPEINFIKEKKKTLSVTTLFMIILAVLIFGIFIKVGVVDVFAKYEKESNELTFAKTELEEIRMKNAEYYTVQAEYQKYTYDYLEETELGIVDRISAQHIMEKYIFPYVTVTSMEISENTMTLGITNASMSTVSKMIDGLNENYFIQYTMIMNADADSAIKLDANDNTKIADCLLTVEIRPYTEKIDGIDSYDGMYVDYSKFRTEKKAQQNSENTFSTAIPEEGQVTN